MCNVKSDLEAQIWASSGSPVSSALAKCVIEMSLLSVWEGLFSFDTQRIDAYWVSDLLWSSRLYAEILCNLFCEVCT